MRFGSRAVAGLAVGLAISAAPLVASAANGVTVTSGGCSGGGSLYCFGPESLQANTGTSVTWTNQSGAPHTVTLCSASACPGAPANTGSQAFDQSLGSSNGSQASVTFTAPGTYVYYCKIHGYAAMHGTVTVTAAAHSPQASPSASSGATTTPEAAPGGTAPAPSTGAGFSLAALIVLLSGAFLAVGALALRRR
jgi:plastocyanin